jgi:hypothetical protein
VALAPTAAAGALAGGGVCANAQQAIKASKDSCFIRFSTEFTILA